MIASKSMSKSGGSAQGQYPTYHPLRLRLDRFWGGGAEGLSPLFVCARATLHWWVGLEAQQVAGF